MSINQTKIYVDIPFHKKDDAKIKFKNRIFWDSKKKLWYFINEKIINGYCNGYKVANIVNEMHKLNKNILTNLKNIGIDPFEEGYNEISSHLVENKFNLFDSTESEILNKYLEMFTVTEKVKGFTLNYVDCHHYRFVKREKYFELRYDHNNDDRIKRFIIPQIKYFYRQLSDINESILSDFKKLKQQIAKDLALGKEIKQTKYENLILFSHTELLNDLHNFISNNTTKTKPYYSSDTVCWHYKYDKLSDDEINEIETKI